MGSLYVLHKEQGFWRIMFCNAAGKFLFGALPLFKTEDEARQAAERLKRRLK